MQKNQFGKYLGKNKFELASGQIEVENLMFLQNFKQPYKVDLWYPVMFLNNEYISLPFIVEETLSDDTIINIADIISIDKDKNISVKNDSAEISISKNGDIKIKGGNVVLEGSAIKIGSDGASFTPLCLEDLPALLSPSPGTGGGAPTPGQITLQGTPKIQKIKAE